MEKEERGKNLDKAKVEIISEKELPSMSEKMKEMIELKAKEIITLYKPPSLRKKSDVQPWKPKHKR